MSFDADLLPLSRKDTETIGDIDLPDNVRELIRHGHSENTRRAYASDLRAFIAWGGSIPTSPEQLARYIADEGGRLHPSTIQRRLTAISAAHGLLDVGSTPHLHPMVRASLRGLQRLHGCKQRQVTPLLVEDLCDILDSTGDSVRDKRDRVLLLVGFAGGLRRSELVGLNIEDIEFVGEGMILNITRSKTDQTAKGRRIGIPHARGRWCAVAETRRWLDILDKDSGPLLRPVTKGGEFRPTRLSREAVATTIKRRVANVGRDPKNFSGHSLRAGFVTSASRLGIPSHSIRRQTGHASDGTMSRYVREGLLFQRNAAGQLL